MPFRNREFDRALLDAMHAAFRSICDALELKCEAEDPATEVIVDKIVSLVNAGDHDADIIANKVIASLRGPIAVP